MESKTEVNTSNMMTSVSANDSDADRSKKRLKINKSDENQNSNKPDVFRIPHSRMRELVHWPLTEVASVPDVQDLQPTLQAVYEAMWELKSHEIIENEYIMDTLKARLQARQVRIVIQNLFKKLIQDYNGGTMIHSYPISKTLFNLQNKN